MCRSSRESRHPPETSKLIIIVAPIASSTLPRSPVDPPCPFHLVAFLSWRRRLADRRRPSPGLHRALRRRRASTRYSRSFPLCYCCAKPSTPKCKVFVFGSGPFITGVPTSFVILQKLSAPAGPSMRDLSVIPWIFPHL